MAFGYSLLLKSVLYKKGEKEIRPLRKIACKMLQEFWKMICMKIYKYTETDKSYRSTSVSQSQKIYKESSVRFPKNAH